MDQTKDHAGPSKDQSKSKNNSISPTKDSRKQDTTKYPYKGFNPADNCKFHFTDQSNNYHTHIVVGHSQIQDKWLVKLDKEDLAFNVDWISYSGGTARFLANIIIRLMKNNADKNLRITAIIWQNSVAYTSLAEMKEIARSIKDTAQQYPQHKVAFPTLQFVPDQEAYFDKIGEFNIFLREENIDMGMSAYNLHKTTMIHKKGKGMVVSQKAWKEFNTNRGKGFHIDISHWDGYVKIIKTFHLCGFRDQKSARNSSAPRLSVELQSTPKQKPLIHPKAFDMRGTLNDIKSRKRNRYGNVQVQDDIDQQVKQRDEASTERQEKELRNQALKRREESWKDRQEKDLEDQALALEKSMKEQQKDFDRRHQEIDKAYKKRQEILTKKLQQQEKELQKRTEEQNQAVEGLKEDLKKFNDWLSSKDERIASCNRKRQRLNQMRQIMIEELKEDMNDEKKKKKKKKME